MLVLFIVIGGFVGAVLSRILRAVTNRGPISEFFIQELRPGLDPPMTLDLQLFTLTFGFTFSINLLSLLGIILGIYLYKQA